MYRKIRDSCSFKLVIVTAVIHKDLSLLTIGIRPAFSPHSFIGQLGYCGFISKVLLFPASGFLCFGFLVFLFYLFFFDNYLNYQILSNLLTKLRLLKKFNVYPISVVSI